MQRVHKGDLIEVIAGDQKGERGEVNRVMPRASRVVVHGINLVRKHQRRTGRLRTQTGIIEFEAPIHLSNIAPVCTKCDEWTRVGFERLADGRKVRVCRRCGAHFDD